MPADNSEGFTMLRNEKKSFQLAVEASEDTNAELVVTAKLKNINIYRNKYGNIIKIKLN